MTAPGSSVGAETGLVRQPWQLVRWRSCPCRRPGAGGRSVWRWRATSWASLVWRPRWRRITYLPYVVAGVIAWSRRPDSRFGPLMLAAGFAMFLSCLQWSSASVPYTIGLACDLLPAALFLHLFLAFPSGRLKLRLERGVVGAAYAAAVGLQLKVIVEA